MHNIDVRVALFILSHHLASHIQHTKFLNQGQITLSHRLNIIEKAVFYFSESG
jgi:hypothetical protein